MMVLPGFLIPSMLRIGCYHIVALPGPSMKLSLLWFYKKHKDFFAHIAVSVMVFQIIINSYANVCVSII